MNLTDFKGCFGDFETMFLDTDFQNYVLKIWHEIPNGEPFALYKKVIGYTKLQHDYLLHIIDVEDENDVDDDVLINKYGIEFVLLSNLVQSGFEIDPTDQD